jgi:hypothetical protein
MLRRISHYIRKEETELWLVDYFHPGEDGDTFLQNVGSYNSHTMSSP